MNMINIAIIGECMVELQKSEHGLTQAVGGDTLNTALYLTRLTQARNVRTSYVTALGDDPFSEDMIQNWNHEGIDTSLICRVSGKQPGIYYIETDNTGERTFHYWRSDSAAKYLFDQDETPQLIDRLMTFDAVYLSGITLAILTANGKEVLFNFLAAFKAKGGKVFFDNNYRPKLWPSQAEAISWYLKTLHLTDTALLTFDDEQLLFGDMNVEQCIERTREAGVSEIIIKRGGEACLVVQDQLAEFVAPKPVSNIVDTTAAGDSFSAGFLARRFTGGNAIESASFGHQLAGNVIQHQGAIIPKQFTPELPQ
ncbi:sugar kinase [Vibrio renipiscarius]|uniref:2-dehydro-3-deoxygluconokinase n=1 Tax=Vibrio renipiscarius TaxID=1461322 RepID=A0A0C2NRK0_9VIBR|nr:sugar kinase [Vibrio renipiscarius]KII75363.1 ketodeoxygluconokinase [Vibrio renipiscarius]KII78815.1 ketodeoxygluconokinase [Vibrio renipiscarius]